MNVTTILRGKHRTRSVAALCAVTTLLSVAVGLGAATAPANASVSRVSVGHLPKRVWVARPVFRRNWLGRVMLPHAVIRAGFFSEGLTVINNSQINIFDNGSIETCLTSGSHQGEYTNDCTDVDAARWTASRSGNGGFFKLYQPALSGSSTCLISTRGNEHVGGAHTGSCDSAEGRSAAAYWRIIKVGTSGAHALQTSLTFQCLVMNSGGSIGTAACSPEFTNYRSEGILWERLGDSGL